MNHADSLTNILLAEINRRPDVYLVGIAGIPGSGKTTLCRNLAALRPDAVVVPMDGYHLPRSRLDAEGLRRRGALHTFDGEAFRADIEQLRRTRCGLFPTFDHAEKDPRPAALRINADVPLVIVEGIYVLMRAWRAENLFDLRVFLDCESDEAVQRLTIRHVQTGLAATLSEGRHRALMNDRLNGEAILADGCRERADLVLQNSVHRPDFCDS